MLEKPPPWERVSKLDLFKWIDKPLAWLAHVFLYDWSSPYGPD